MYHQYKESTNEFDNDIFEYEPDHYELQKYINSEKIVTMKELYEKNLTEHERKLIDDMLGIMTTPLEVAHFFLGGHIQLECDNGYMYHKWANEFGPQIGSDGEELPRALKARNSSHASKKQQYAISGPVIREALFGTRVDDNGVEYTWIQLERNPINEFKEFKKDPITFIINVMLHMIDYFGYKISKCNIGPYGISNYTEAQPLVINANISPEKSLERAELWKEIIFVRMGDTSGLEMQMIQAGLEVPFGSRERPRA